MVKDELGNVELQLLTKRHVDGLVGRPRGGTVAKRRRWSARSVNYMLSLMMAVLESELRQGRIARNVVKLIDRIPEEEEREEMKTLSEADMNRILDRECRDQHLWTLALVSAGRDRRASLGRRRSEGEDDPDRGEPCRGR
ncbi:hypothetical protein [Nocardia sp. NPDC051570]|uniref:hypothetical protein n=1 Tax=Nocardia sp. NPDC051570 TaxID=3364324 RepID=UPI003787FCE4